MPPLPRLWSSARGPGRDAGRCLRWTYAGVGRVARSACRLPGKGSRALPEGPGLNAASRCGSGSCRAGDSFGVRDRRDRLSLACTRHRPVGSPQVLRADPFARSPARCRGGGTVVAFSSERIAPRAEAGLAADERSGASRILTSVCCGRGLTPRPTRCSSLRGHARASAGPAAETHDVRWTLGVGAMRSLWRCPSSWRPGAAATA